MIMVCWYHCLFFLLQVCHSTVRALAWAPPEAFMGSAAEDARCLFAVGGGQGFCGAFDTRDPTAPGLDLTSGSRSARQAVDMLSDLKCSCSCSATHLGVHCIPLLKQQVSAVSAA